MVAEQRLVDALCRGVKEELEQTRRALLNGLHVNDGRFD